MRNSTRVPFEIRYPERQLLCLPTESLVVKHGRDAARPVFSAPPTLCFHKSRPGGVSLENGQVLPHPLSRSVHPCPQLFLLHLRRILVLVLFESSLLPVSSSSRRLSACARFSFKCFFMWFRRFLSTCIFFPSRFAQRHPPRATPVPSARLYF